jgi:hypothetical protein
MANFLNPFQPRQSLQFNRRHIEFEDAGVERRGEE